MMVGGGGEKLELEQDGVWKTFPQSGSSCKRSNRGREPNDLARSAEDISDKRKLFSLSLRTFSCGVVSSKLRPRDDDDDDDDDDEFHAFVILTRVEINCERIDVRK
uniref:Uncharacterized protein n=1 Tax=Vespula pensylvanica TaxID=30213 RepID=A0A834PBP9_VESPE|nr:hypothetical protein H0235_003358 [Vespula pensylvanica]